VNSIIRAQLPPLRSPASSLCARPSSPTPPPAISVALLVALLLVALADPAFAQPSVFDFDSGTVQGWTFQGTFLWAGSTQLPGAFNSDFTRRWEDRTNFPGDLGADPLDGAGCLLFHTPSGQLGIANPPPNATRWQAGVQSPDLTTSPEWQCAAGVSVWINQSFFPQDCVGNCQGVILEFVVKLINLDTDTPLFLCHGTPLLETNGQWQRTEFNWLTESSYCGTLPSRYSVEAVKINVYGDINGSYPGVSDGAGIYFDQVALIPRTAALRYYVDRDATGANNGTSWTNAFTTLSSALDPALFPCDPKEIWVAEGTYRPAPANGDRNATFAVRRNVGLYGGFYGTETQRDQRNPRLYRTILSGDLNGNDAPTFVNNGENSNSVVTGSGADATAVLDGFTITGGFRHGLFNDQGSPTVRGCRFVENRATDEVGGGMYNDNGSSPRVISCEFVGNVGGFGGGGIYNRNGSDPVIANCSFTGNRAGGAGGALYNDVGTTPHLINCTFSENVASAIAGGIYHAGGSVGLANCILWNNRVGASVNFATQIDGPQAANVRLLHSCIRGLSLPYNGDGSIGTDPGFIDADGADNGPGTVDDNLRLWAASPCIDAGDGAELFGSSDLDGNPRRMDDPATADTGAGTPPIVDMGAYESYVDCEPNGVADILESDCNGDGLPDPCVLSADIGACRYPTALSGNSTGVNSATFLGAPDDLYAGIGNGSVTYQFDCALIVDGPGPDFNVYEVDFGTAEFLLVDALVSANGVDFVRVTPTAGPVVDIAGDEAHSNPAFARSYDLNVSGLTTVRFLRLVGLAAGAPGGNSGFDLDAVGIINGGADCNGNGRLDSCDIASGAASDTNGNGVPDSCEPFQNVAGVSGTSDSGAGTGVAWGDYDGDGKLDLYLTKSGGQANRLFRNNGNDTFTDVAAAAGVNVAQSSRGVAFGDYDNDSHLDMYVTSTTSQPALLYHNQGSGAFTDVAAAAGVVNDGTARTGPWGDYDNDGDLDIYVAKSGANFLFRNDGAGFTEVAGPAGVADTGDSRGAEWADYDNDGDQDIFVGNVDFDKLFRNRGDGTFEDVTAVAGVAGVSGTGSTRGVAWGDYDNDGFLDLYVANISGVASTLYHNNGGGTFQDVTSTAGVGATGDAQCPAWADYDNDGHLDLYVAVSGGSNKLFRNQGNGTFADVSAESGTDDAADGFGAAWGDYNGDGFVDLYVSGEASKLFKNGAVSSNHWIHIDLVGVRSNRSGIGARIRVVAGGLSQIREISGGSGLQSQNSLTAEFGLGAATTVDLVEVRWPSGIVNSYTQGAIVDRRLTVGESLGGATNVDVLPTLPLAFALYPAVPNPFNPSTTLRFDLPEPSRVYLRVYDVSGRLVKTLQDGASLEGGVHRVVWSGDDDRRTPVAAGVYFYRLEAGTFLQTRQMVLLK
jgi:hypothetical protein